MAIDYNQIRLAGKAKKLAIEANKDVFQSSECMGREFFGKFSNWYQGNHNPETGLFTLYRSINLSDEQAASMVDSVSKGKILMPHGMMEIADLLNTADTGKILNHISGAGDDWDRKLVNAYFQQESGKDISDFMEEFACASGGNAPLDIAMYWSTDPSFDVGRYRMQAEFSMNKAWRAGKIKHGKWNMLFDTEFEWTTLGPVNSQSIVNIYDRQSRRTLYRRK